MQISLSALPSGNPTIFESSSFFRGERASCILPLPDEVRRTASLGCNLNRPPPALFPSLGLLVKYGRAITIAEGQCLWIIRKLIGHVVPVPEVYGWRTEGDDTFIYMELIQGDTLEKRWDTLNDEERADICLQLRRMVESWRELRQEPSDRFIGHVKRQPLQDAVFISSRCPPAGPFADVSSFHDWFVFANRPELRQPGMEPHPMRSSLPDNVPIVFTHGDLHRSNIIISSKGAPHVVAVIDWHQSGWYPAYWEFCKALWTTPIGDEWETKYLPTIVNRWDCYDSWDYFVLSLGV